MKGTLRYIRVATRARDTYEGFLYLHTWKTGNQELVFTSHIFTSHNAAKLFADKEQLEYKGKEV
jgi:hypothetical protein